jgi:hypothetical protein
MKGFRNLRSSRVQMDVWGAFYAQVRAIAEAAIDALAPAQTGNGISFDRTFVGGIRDLGERTETAFLHRTSIDLIVHHSIA